MEKKLLLCPLIFFLLFCSCKDDELVIPHHVVSGILPMEIKNVGNSFGQDEIKFSYQDCQVLRIGNKSYEYLDGKVNRIYLGPERYMEFEYDEYNRVVGFEHYIIPWNGDSLVMNDQKMIIYSEDIITEFKDIDDMETNIVYHNNSTGNTDSIEVYNNESQLIKIYKYEYDLMNNTYLNLKIPLFGALEMVERSNKNNITRKLVQVFGDDPYSFDFRYEYTYNVDNYPIEVVISGTTLGATNQTITYQTCN